MDIAKKEQLIIHPECLDILTPAQRKKFDEWSIFKEQEEKNRQIVYEWARKHRKEVLEALGVEEKADADDEQQTKMMTTIAQIAKAYGCNVWQLINYISGEQQIQRQRAFEQQTPQDKRRPMVAADVAGGRRPIAVRRIREKKEVVKPDIHERGNAGNQGCVLKKFVFFLNHGFLR